MRRQETARPAAVWLDWALCGALMAVAAAFRAYLLHTVFAHIDSDQAIVGLMAYHIRAGDRPIFYYGQAYQGSLEAYLAALVFMLWGAGEWTVRLPTLAFSVAWIGALYWLGVTLYGRRIAVLTGLFVALGPAILLAYSTAAGYSYIEAMLCGTLLLLLAIRYPDLRALPVPVALAGGLLAGVGVWVQPLTAEYLAPIAVAYAVRVLVGAPGSTMAGWLRLGRSLAAIAAGAAVGSAPLLLYNLRHHWATAAFLHSRAQSGSYLVLAGHLVTQALPVLVGLVTPTTVAPVFARLVAAHPLHYWAGLILGLYVVARLILGPRGLPGRIAALGRPAGWLVDDPAARGPRRYRPGRDGVLALFAVCPVIFFLLTSFGAMPWATRLPRYLIPLYTITPLVLDGLIGRSSGRVVRRLGTAALVLLIAGSVTTTLSTEPRGGIAGLDQLLRERQVRVAYADYWLANRIAFETHEQIISVPITAVLGVGQERVPGYLAIAQRTPAARLAWILPHDSPAEQSFRLLLRRRHARAIRTPWDDWVVYSDLSQPLRPTP